MEEKDKEKSLESQYPSVDLAYDFVKLSYDWMVTRLEAINSKMQGLLMFSVTITVAIPVIAKSTFDNISFSSIWFIMAMVVFIFLVGIGILGMRMGSIVMPHPKMLYDKYLYCSHWEFQKRTIYWAGEHFDKNKALIDKKAAFRDIMTFCLIIEILCIVIWIAI